MVYLKITLVFVLFMLSLFFLDYLYFLPVGVILLFFLNAVEKEARQKQRAAADPPPVKIFPFVAPASVCADEHSSVRIDRKSNIYAVDKNSTLQNSDFYPRDHWKPAWKNIHANAPETVNK